MASERLKLLSGFQLKCLLHAMQFPDVEFITYSTCSIYKEENEMVVCKAVNELESKYGKFEIVKCIPEWKHRGEECEGLSKSETDKMIRCNNEDDTNGFFVTLLHRIEKVDEIVIKEMENEKKLVEKEKEKENVKKEEMKRKREEVKSKNKIVVDISEIPTQPKKRRRKNGQFKSHKISF